MILIFIVCQVIIKPTIHYDYSAEIKHTVITYNSEWLGYDSMGFDSVGV